MQRVKVQERADKADKLEAIGLSFHAWDDYWNEGVAYKFESAEIDKLEAAANELHGMCLNAARYAINHNRLGQMGIPEQFHEAIRQSFDRNEFSLYGRFDFAFDGDQIKMLEYNADTPTSLLESAVAQWDWMEEVKPGTDQFNSLHERLIEQWQKFRGAKKVYFASLRDNEEDWVCVHYMMDTAAQAGLEVQHIWLDDIGYDPMNQVFVDDRNRPIEALFKLYPWEWLMREDFAQYLTTTKTQFVEPIWKSVLSNKALLPILWEVYRDHPLLLPSYFEADKLKSFAKKPFFSREGANVELHENGLMQDFDTGPYGAEGYIYQQLIQLPKFDDVYPIIGAWIVGEESAGICIREDRLRITTNMSHFIPHYFTDNEEA
ncbi:glutathionylspermidine synthase [Achromobacter phage Motura]|uniref:Glutathionylspermidine synthase n=1 Tax=Achromobacter phage Motura TaxID=2591403 RepID=A0A514CT70_9CAUD|nr:glutathionylspermidine synthase [Achromobacter phage Motura]QDH83688.1 glutathionylspermidine synthase [Achromobacter phage Motura]